MYRLWKDSTRNWLGRNRRMGEKEMKILWIALTITMAFALGKRVLFWAVMAYLFSWVALLAVLVIPANEKRMDARLKKIESLTEEVEVKKEVGQFNNVDDLFQQLEKK